MYMYTITPRISIHATAHPTYVEKMSVLPTYVEKMSVLAKAN